MCAAARRERGETDLLQPARRVDQLFAVTLSGGSAFGLDAATGVMAWLEEQGVGFRVSQDVIVPHSVLRHHLRLGLVTSKVRPVRRQGARLCAVASKDALAEGASALVRERLSPRPAGRSGSQGRAGFGQYALPQRRIGWRSGGGQCHRRNMGLPDGPTSGRAATRRRELRRPSWGAVGRLTASITDRASEHHHRGSRHRRKAQPRGGQLPRAGQPTDGLAMTIRPCHTIRDGDTMFAMATGESDATADLTALGAAAVEVTAQAVPAGRALRHRAGRHPSGV